MSYTRRATSLAAVGAVAALALAACGGSGSNGPSASSSSGGSGFNAAITSIVNPSTKAGGTLKLSATGDCDAWDGANMYYAWCWDMSRLYMRNLMGYQSKPGPTQAVPDIATKPGEHDADFKTWTYHIKDGIKWQDGSPVTSADVKYGVERLWATDVFGTGAGFYFTCLLDTCGADGTPTYKGPYADPSGQLSTIETPDDKTVIFHLNASTPTFDYYMSLPTSAPVKKDKDTGKSYTNNVFSNGPFKFSAYSPGKSVEWTRNDQWAANTDDIRKPLVDKVQLTIYPDNPDAADQHLKAGDSDLEADGGVQATLQAQIAADPKLKANADNPATGFTRYLVVFQTVAPLTNPDCRKAIFYAINKTDLQLARGGTSAGEIASSMTPPGIPGHEEPDAYNPYPDGSDNTGDLAKAKEELQKCGQPNGFTLKMAYVPGGKADKVLAATQAALKRVGITVTPLAGEQASYYSTFIGSPQNVINKNMGMAQAAWGPDFPTLVGYYQNIVTTGAIKPSGTSNYASLSDPKVDDGVQQASQTTDENKLEDLGKQVNHAVMDAAVYLPYLWDSAYYYRNPRLTNVYLTPGTGFYYDYVNIGTSDGK
jgi:peptide/nickel transport system substrate-binding protein